MSTQDARKTTRPFWYWFDPEAIIYALVGLVVVVLGTRALARWAIAEWASGERVVPIAIVSACALPVLAALILLGNRKRFWYLGIALGVVGGMSFLLAEFGLQLPATWLK